MVTYNEEVASLPHGCLASAYGVPLMSLTHFTNSSETGRGETTGSTDLLGGIHHVSTFAEKERDKLRNQLKEVCLSG